VIFVELNVCGEVVRLITAAIIHSNTCRVCRVKRMTCRLKSDHGSSVVRPCSLREVLRVT
jgi:hypothetical protein